MPGTYIYIYLYIYMYVHKYVYMCVYVWCDACAYKTVSALKAPNYIWLESSTNKPVTLHTKQTCPVHICT